MAYDRSAAYIFGTKNQIPPQNPQKNAQILGHEIAPEILPVSCESIEKTIGTAETRPFLLFNINKTLRK